MGVGLGWVGWFFVEGGMLDGMGWVVGVDGMVGFQEWLLTEMRYCVMRLDGGTDTWQEIQCSVYGIPDLGF